MTIMIIMAVIVSIILILISYILTHKTTYPRKVSPLIGGVGGGNNIEEESRSQYECGIELFEEKIGRETRERFYIKFYIIAIIFLIFDIESILLYPASILFTKLLRRRTLLEEEERSVSEIIRIEENGMGIEKEMLNGNIGESHMMGYITLCIFMYLLVIGIYYELKKEII
jgi:NADH:ubiquinone oxidoreductase subunit 3 (subunit A)